MSNRRKEAAADQQCAARKARPANDTVRMTNLSRRFVHLRKSSQLFVCRPQSTCPTRIINVSPSVAATAFDKLIMPRSVASYYHRFVDVWELVCCDVNKYTVLF